MCYSNEEIMGQVKMMLRDDNAELVDDCGDIGIVKTKDKFTFIDIEKAYPLDDEYGFFDSLADAHKKLNEI